MNEDQSLRSPPNRATIKIDVNVVVSRSELEQEHRLLIARLHLLRKQLGYPPLTPKEQIRQASK